MCSCSFQNCVQIYFDYYKDRSQISNQSIIEIFIKNLLKNFIVEKILPVDCRSVFILISILHWWRSMSSKHVSNWLYVPSFLLMLSFRSRLFLRKTGFNNCQCFGLFKTFHRDNYCLVFPVNFFRLSYTEADIRNTRLIF